MEDDATKSHYNRVLLIQSRNCFELDWIRREERQPQNYWGVHRGPPFFHHRRTGEAITVPYTAEELALVFSHCAHEEKDDNLFF